ncbi:MAG: hypothetical protein HN742_31875 [Lentisphaerae bacterium]|jgi:hypothetical protein|nr:hypothetical protein [Lentisphaerota bacterium]MBT5609493.1 hypothetical protein [Lentisphaerota bacterium]MBT7061641.1 hypothetical protein [Lentisphaerota bacterium]MBT7846512.1 hypothetical protein [Lentisphaerota bacterium]
MKQCLLPAIATALFFFACIPSTGHGASADVTAFPDATAAREAWQPQFGSLPVTLETDKNGARCLALPAEFAAAGARACWDWSGALDLPGDGRVMFEISGEGSDLVEMAALYFGTPGGWYARFWGGVSGTWRKRVFRTDSFGSEGTPDDWDKVTTCRISFWSNGAGDATFRVRAFRVEGIEPGENLLANGSFEIRGIGIPPGWGSGHWGLPRLPWAADPELWRQHWGVDTKVAREGTSSLRIRNASGRPLLKATSNWFVRPKHASACTVSAWLRSDTEGLPVTLRCGGKEAQVTVGKAWTQAVVRGVEGTNRLAAVVAPGQAGTLWIDTVQAQALDEPTAEFHPAFTDGPLADQTASVEWSPPQRIAAVAAGRPGRRPVTPARTAVDGHGRFLLNGVPYLQHSFGLEAVHGMAVLDAVAEAGFRDVCIMFRSSDSTERMTKIFDHCARIGLYVIPWMDGHIPRETFVQHITALRGHPALLCWYVYDEPHGEQRFAEANARLALAKELDPDKPAFINYLSSKLEGHLGDIYSTDVYPIPRSGPLTAIQAVRRMKAAAVKEHKPVWMWLQGTGYAYFAAREPSARELSCMVYGSVIEGARGIYYFAQMPRSKPCLDEMRALCVELDALSPALHSLETAPIPSCDDRNILHAAFAENDHVTILSVSTRNTPIDATLSLKGIGDNGDVLFEGRTLRARDSVWQDRFGPYERHVYRFRLGGGGTK